MKKKFIAVGAAVAALAMSALLVTGCSSNAGRVRRLIRMEA